MTKKVKNVKGFQMNRKTGHVSYVYEQKQKKAKSIGFTHNKDDKAPKRKLNHNINPNDLGHCYAKTKIEIQKSSDYRSKQDYKGYKIHAEDKPIIVEIIKNNKKRR